MHDLTTIDTLAIRAGTEMGRLPVVETVTFRLLPGTDDATFLAAVHATAGLVAGQPGFLRRDLSRDEAGLWADMIEWADEPKAMAAGAAVMADPGFGALMAVIDPVGVTVRHAPVVWSMGG